MSQVDLTQENQELWNKLDELYKGFTMDGKINPRSIRPMLEQVKNIVQNSLTGTWMEAIIAFLDWYDEKKPGSCTVPPVTIDLSKLPQLPGNLLNAFADHKKCC